MVGAGGPRYDRGMRSFLALLVASGGFACSDYSLNPDKGDNPGADDTGLPGGEDGGDITAGDCPAELAPPAALGVGDACPQVPEGGFQPIVEWGWGTGYSCTALPTVADLDGDGMPEVIVNGVPGLIGGKGDLTVLNGEDGSVVWQDQAADLAYGAAAAVADLDGDGSPEIIVVREYQSSLFGTGDYRAAAYSATGTELWETPAYAGLDFDWAAQPVVSDMDHDGVPEIVVGRVILTPEGEERGRGEHGRGSYGVVSLGGLTVSEASVPAVTDLDLDGIEEVVTGNAMYGPDGELLWHDPMAEDAMVSIANLDDDPEGEFVAVSYNTVRAVDTDGGVLWGPLEIPTANIVSTAAIADLDADGWPEIVVAGGNTLYALAHDGGIQWSAAVTDESGATGASIFDFEGDGVPEVVYIDEVQMVAYDGQTGAVKFRSSEHRSATMFDYPVVADADADGHAEILVCHQGFSRAVSMYGDAADSWRAARPLWNQHAYSIGNIADDLRVPVTAEPSFTTTNTWHSAIATDGSSVTADVTAQVVDVCLQDCDQGYVRVDVQLVNLAAEPLAVDTPLALVATMTDGREEIVGVELVPAGVESGWSSATVRFDIPTARLATVASLEVRADDDGRGAGVLTECAEGDNRVAVLDAVCP